MVLTWDAWETRATMTTNQKTPYYPMVAIIEHYAQSLPGLGRVELLSEVASRLSDAIGKEKPWHHRYIHNVERGNQPPSQELKRAVVVLGAMLDDTPAMIANTEKVTVYAAHGAIKAGSLVQGASRLCPYPPCNISFVPAYANQVYCMGEHRRLDYNRLRRERRRKNETRTGPAS